jgi:hypothetical protein
MSTTDYAEIYEKVKTILGRFFESPEGHLLAGLAI